ncbi:MAG: Dabb family protein [Oscillospiraceae bacterium]|nr:Dabb family protein [Oscillospiraceae bacterium]MDD4368756.1 Dabb family protein [Oscillospiraceae bacterium]
MIKHIVSWRHQEGFTPQEQTEHAERIKQELLAVADAVSGVISLEVRSDLLSTSNQDLILDATFVSEDSLLKYQKHPQHVKAGEFIRSVMTNRTCCDYQTED